MFWVPVPLAGQTTRMFGLELHLRVETMVFAMKYINRQALMLRIVVSIILTTCTFCFVYFCMFAISHYNFFTSSEGIPVTPYAVSFAREYEIVLEEPILVNYDKTIFFDIKISGDSYYREIDAEYTGSGYSWDERATRYFAKHLFPEGGQELSVVLYEDGTSLKMRMKRFYNSVRTPYLTYSVPDNFTAKMKGDRIKIAYDGDVELRNVRIILENW